MKSKKEEDSPRVKDCQAAGDLLVPYLDGEASAQERLQVETHLASCARCTRDFETQQRIGNALMPSGRVDGKFSDHGNSIKHGDFAGVSADSVRAKSRLQSRRTRQRVTFAFLSLAAVALMACTLVLLKFGQQVPEEATDHMLGALDILEAFEEQGLEPTQEIVQLLLDVTDAEGLEGSDGEAFDAALFDLLMEEDVDDENL
jgi:hypothetical protein